MSRTYKATGINLKSMPMGEADRLLTILTREFGLVRAVAMGSRKHNSSLAGRSGLFVVNDLLIAKGRSLDKIAQAETLESFPGLGQDLKKLTASQYLAELCLYQALSDQPQEELFYLLNEHLKRLERSPVDRVLHHLTHAVFQLLVMAGIAPQLHFCCVTQQPLLPNFDDASWRIGFSIPSGGVVTLKALETLRAKKAKPALRSSARSTQTVVKAANSSSQLVQNQNKVGESRGSDRASFQSPIMLYPQLTATDLALLQQLAQVELPLSVGSANSSKSKDSKKLEDPKLIKTEDLNSGSHFAALSPDYSDPRLQNSGNLDPQLDKSWHSIERTLRHYAQYHFDRPIRSATLIDTCFTTADFFLTS